MAMPPLNSLDQLIQDEQDTPNVAATPPVVNAATASAPPAALPPAAPGTVDWAHSNLLGGGLGQEDPDARSARMDAETAAEQGGGGLVGWKQGLAEKKFAADQAMKDRSELLNETKAHSEMALQNFTLNTEQQTHADAAHFLTGFTKVQPGDPAAATKIAALFQAAPNAGRDPTVIAAIKGFEEAHALHNKFTEAGGASQFSGPAADAYHRAILAGSEPLAAAAAATNTQKGEEQVMKLRGEGHILPSDLEWGPNATTTNPNFNADGSINYSKLTGLGEQRKGDQARIAQGTAQSKAEIENLKAQDQQSKIGQATPKDIEAARKYLGQNKVAPGTPQKVGPDGQITSEASEDNKRWWNAKKMVDFHDGQVLQAQKVSSLSPAAAPTQSTVTQNGHTYVRQPDGSYK